jgi:hypothetical protein
MFNNIWAIFFTNSSGHPGGRPPFPESLSVHLKGGTGNQDFTPAITFW